MSNKVYLEWENLNQNWEGVDMLWEEVVLIQEVARVVRGAGGMAAYIEGNPWDITKRELGEEKTQKFIKIFSRVNGLDYGESIETNEKIKVSVEQLQKVFDETEKIGVKITF
jgi:hypothetical protein